MTTILILITIAVNIGLAIYYLRQFVKRKSIAGIAFVVTWSMHYIIGNILALVSKDSIYGQLSFKDFEGAYLAAVLLGQYFLVVYAYLLQRRNPLSGSPTHYTVDALVPLVTFLGVALCAGALFVIRIGISQYFSRDLATYRARLGDYAFEGIGVYYYGATLTIPAVMMFVSYAMRYPLILNRVLSAIAFALVVILFIPMGGRGRVMNMIFILVLSYIITKREYQLRKMASWRVLLLVGVLFIGSFIWGHFRENPASRPELSGEDLIRSWVVDTTRLQFQSFIFEKYPLDGAYWPQHYVESVLGPLVKLAPIKRVNLIQEVSALWYRDTIGGTEVLSAISPSFLGELYLTFGIVGLILSPALFYLVVQSVARVFDCRHPLSIAVVLYLYQFGCFHGGLYSLFDLLVLTVPVFIGNKLLSRPSGRPGPYAVRRHDQLVGKDALSSFQ